MKKYLIISIFSFFISFYVNAQHWLQPGATYNYSYQMHTSYGTKQAKYIKDTIIDNKTVCQLSYQSQNCYSGYGCYPVSNPTLFYLHRRNDSIFRVSVGSERFLYNLNPTVGDTWDFGPAPGGATSNCMAESITIVDSIKMDTIYGMPIKKIFTHPQIGSYYGFWCYITDRYGAACPFLDWNNFSACQPDPQVTPWYQYLACYTDSTYNGGSYCSSPFVAPVNVQYFINNTNITVFPLPFNDHLCIRYETYFWNDPLIIRIFDMQGRLITTTTQTVIDNVISIETKDIESGTYLLETETSRGKERVKIIK